MRENKKHHTGLPGCHEGNLTIYCNRYIIIQVRMSDWFGHLLFARASDFWPLKCSDQLYVVFSGRKKNLLRTVCTVIIRDWSIHNLHKQQ